jgi:threonine/homoserine/homoserine lactone efflux protein
MPAVETLGAFFAAALVMAVAPGPDNLFVLAQSAIFGARAGLCVTLGLVTGLAGHTAAVALGAAALLRASPVAFLALRCAGAAYLLYLAWLSWRAGTIGGTAEQGRGAFPGFPALYRRGVCMNIANPKVTLFFLALLPQFADPARGPVVWQIVLFGALFQAATVLVFGAVALAGGRLARLFTSPRARIVLNRGAACVFAAFALALALG